MPAFRKDELKIFSGNSNPYLVQKICEYLGVKPGSINIGRFPDGEIDVKVEEDIRGTDVFIVESLSHPVNEHLVELCIILDCLKRASADRITAVIPYYGYSRQDRKAEGRVPISAKLVANLITVSGANRVLTMDLHAPQIQGFFDIPLDHLLAFPVICNFISKEIDLAGTTIVAPDLGAVKLALNYATYLNLPIAILDKRRNTPTQTEVLHIIGEIEGRNILFVDDIVSTGTSLIEAAKRLKEKGARKIYCAVTHAVLSKNAQDNILNSPVERIFITDTINHKQLNKKFTVVTIAPLFAEAIKRIHKSESISSLFNFAQKKIFS
ncbi:MAG: ribose-phosphate diphosphokinase [Planctomycetota bacterium]